MMKNKSMISLMGRKARRAAAFVLSFAMATSTLLIAPDTSAAAKTPKLSAKKATITVGKKKVVKIKNTTKKKVKKLSLKSSKKKVATVKKNSNIKFTVTGKKAGKSTITATVKLKKAVKKKKIYKLKFNATIKAKKSSKTPAASQGSSESLPPATQGPATKVTASTQAEVENALKNAASSKVSTELTISGDIETLTIDQGDYSNVDLIVDAPRATITNNATFKSITIKSIAKNTWYEKGDKNKITVTNEKAVHIIVQTIKALSSIIFNGTATETSIVEVQSGNVGSIGVNTTEPVKVVTNGTGATAGNVSDITISAAAKVDIETTGDSQISKISVSAAANVALDIAGKAEVSAIEVNATGATTDITAADDAKVGTVDVTKDATATVSAADNAAVESVNAADGATATVNASGNATIDSVLAGEGATATVSASGSADINKVTAKDGASVDVKADGESNVSTVKVEGDAEVAVSGDTKNTTTIDITAATEDANVEVNTDSVKVEKTEDQDIDKVIDNKTETEIPVEIVVTPTADPVSSDTPTSTVPTTTSTPAASGTPASSATPATSPTASTADTGTPAASATASPTASAATKKITLTAENNVTTIAVGDKVKLVVKDAGKRDITTSTDVTFESSNVSVAESPKSGTAEVTGKAEGETTIKATDSVTKKSASIKIMVIDIENAALSVSANPDKKIKVGGKTVLTATLVPKTLKLTDTDGVKYDWAFGTAAKARETGTAEAAGTKENAGKTVTVEGFAEGTSKVTVTAKLGTKSKADTTGYTVTVDNTAPTLSSVAATSKKVITATFSEEIEGTNPSMTVTGSAAGAVALTGLTFKIDTLDKTKLIITSGTDFAVDTYTLSAPTGITDEAGNTVAELSANNTVAFDATVKSAIKEVAVGSDNGDVVAADFYLYGGESTRTITLKAAATQDSNTETAVTDSDLADVKWTVAPSESDILSSPSGANQTGATLALTAETNKTGTVKVVAELRGVKSEEITIKVDTTAPTVAAIGETTGNDIRFSSDYKKIIVTFSEEINVATADLAASALFDTTEKIKKDSSDISDSVTAAISNDKKSIEITYTDGSAFAGGEYSLKFANNKIKDLAGNVYTPNTTALTITKEKTITAVSITNTGDKLKLGKGAIDGVAIAYSITEEGGSAKTSTDDYDITYTIKDSQDAAVAETVAKVDTGRLVYLGDATEDVTLKVSMTFTNKKDEDITKTTDAATFTVDLTAPSVTGVEIKDSAKTVAIVTFSEEVQIASEITSVKTVTVDGVNGTASDYTIAVDSTDKNKINITGKSDLAGLYEFTLDGVSDAYGNEFSMKSGIKVVALAVALTSSGFVSFSSIANVVSPKSSVESPTVTIKCKIYDKDGTAIVAKNGDALESSDDLFKDYGLFALGKSNAKVTGNNNLTENNYANYKSWGDMYFNNLGRYGNYCDDNGIYTVKINCKKYKTGTTESDGCLKFGTDYDQIGVEIKDKGKVKKVEIVSISFAEPEV